jgi:hypothetical protein
MLSRRSSAVLIDQRLQSIYVRVSPRAQLFERMSCLTPSNILIYIVRRFRTL